MELAKLTGIKGVPVPPRPAPPQSPGRTKKAGQTTQPEMQMTTRGLEDGLPGLGEPWLITMVIGSLSPRPGVVGPLPNGLFMAYKWG